MSMQRAYHHLSEEKRAAIMALAREGFSGAHIARHCGISGATISREFSRQFPKGIPLKERRKRYEAAAAHTRYRANRKKSKPRGKLLPQVIATAEKLIRRGYSPGRWQIPSLKARHPQSVSTAGCTPASCFMEIGLCSGIKAGGAFSGKEGKKYTVVRSHRPASIESRREFGHFEVDTVESGHNGTGCVFTIVERKPVCSLPAGAESCTSKNFYNILKRLIKNFSLEQSNHLQEIAEKNSPGIKKIENELRIPFYFADPTVPGRREQTRIQMAF